MNIIHPRHLFPLLTAEDWLDWVSYYSLSPWGETRADMRQEALIATLAAPLMGEGYEIPSFSYPYEREDDGQEIDSEATMEAVSNFRERFYGKDSCQSQHSNRCHDSNVKA